MSASTASQKINSFDDVVSLKNVKKGSEDAAAVEAAKKTLGVDRDGDDNVFPSINRFNFCVGDRATSLSHRRKDAFLQVLVCTGNLANTEPTRDCLSAWIPKNGRISEVIQDGMTGDNAYCYDDDNNVTLCKDDEDHSALHQSSGGANRDGLFDIIVIGMQEATFFSDEVARISASTFGQLRRATMIYSRYFSICKQRTPERVSNGVVDVEPSVLTGRNGTAVISKMLQDRLPQHNSIMHYKRGEMRMIIFVKKNLVREVSNLDCRAENTGIGSLLPNKGGIVASFSIRKTSLAFVSAHLEAHEGHSHYVNRCSSLANILSGAKVGPTPQRYDASLSNHYCFVLGDLNFRTCFETEVLADSEEKHEHCVTRAKAMIEERDWKGLHKADELSKAIREKRCLVGFRTEVCQFPATFKMKKKQGHVYDERRTPSYTDRILWTSLEGLESNIRLLAHHSCPKYISSDHKPIRAAFAITPNETFGNMRNVAQKQAQNHSISLVKMKMSFPFDDRNNTHIFIANIQCLDLTTVGARDNLIVAFDTHPSKLIGRMRVSRRCCRFAELWSKRTWNGVPVTAGVMQGQCPNWGDEEIVLKLPLSTDRVSLQGSMLFISLVKYETKPKEGKLVGTVRLNLYDLCYPNETAVLRHKYLEAITSGDADSNNGMLDKVQIEELLMRNGQVYGILRFTVLVWYYPQHQGVTRLKSRRQLTLGMSRKFNRQRDFFRKS